MLPEKELRSRVVIETGFEYLDEWLAVYLIERKRRCERHYWRREQKGDNDWQIGEEDDAQPARAGNVDKLLQGERSDNRIFNLDELRYLVFHHLQYTPALNLEWLLFPTPLINVFGLERALDTGRPLCLDEAEFLLIFFHLVRETLHEALHMWRRESIRRRRLADAHKYDEIFLRMPSDDILAELLRYFVEVHTDTIYRRQ